MIGRQEDLVADQERNLGREREGGRRRENEVHRDKCSSTDRLRYRPTATDGIE